MTQLKPPHEPTPELLAERFAAVFDPSNGFASACGFSGFENRVVADIGTGDGAYSDLCLQLGAKGLTCFELELESIKRAWDAKRLDSADVQIGDAVELSRRSDFMGHFDVVTAYNIAPHQTPRLIGAARRLLRPGGDLIVTSAEVGLMSRVVEIEGATKPYFASVSSTRVWQRKVMPSSNMLTIAINKQGI